MKRLFAVLAMTLGGSAVFAAGAVESSGAVISVPSAAPGGWTLQANPGLLISAEELKAALTQPRTLVLDARALDDYREGHVPGSILVDRATLEDIHVIEGAEYSDLKSPAEVTEPLRGVGVRNDSRIVIVGDGGSVGPRLFWVLDYLGHPSVSVLDGGYAAWVAAGGTVAKDVPTVARGDFAPQPVASRIADYAYVKAALSNDAIITCNALSASSFKTEAIPGTVSLPQSALKVTGEIPYFKAAGELKDLLLSIGYTPEKEIVFYCNAGNAASVDYLAARVLGVPRVRNYDGSLTEWKARGDPLTPSGSRT